MDIVNALTNLLATQGTLATFLAGLYNEEAMLFMVFLSGAGSVALWKAVLFGFIGNMIHDSLLFALGRSRFIHWTKNTFKLSERMEGVVKVIESMRKKTDFIPLFISKFIYGSRTALIIYVSHTRTPYFKFLVENTLASLAWATILVPIAYLAGKGFTKILSVATVVEKMLGAFILIVLMGYLSTKIFKSFVLKSKKN